jgi:hypothetical protein
MSRIVVVFSFLLSAFTLSAQKIKPFKMNINGIKVGILNNFTKKYVYTDYTPQNNASVSAVNNINGGISLVIKTGIKEQKYRIVADPFQVDEKDSVFFINHEAERFDGKKCKILFQVNPDLTLYIWVFTDDNSEVFFCDIPAIGN